MNRRRSLAALATAAIAIALLAYLRDPPWLAQLSSGFGAWRADPEGFRYRHMAGRASFFVPAAAIRVTFRVRAPFTSPADWPIAATFSVDDRPAERLVLTDGTWRRVTIELRRPTRRRVRRIDIHADRTRAWYHGLDVSEFELSMR